MPNIKSSSIVTQYAANGFHTIEVKLIARYIDYVIDINTGEVVDGDKKTRGEHEYVLYFYRDLNARELPDVRVCPSCGKTMDINESGKCSYCGSIYNLEDFWYILDRVDQIS